MNIKKLTASLCVCMTLMVTAVSNAGEQLKVFILAGQSNMVGHARAHTIATLYASDSPRDRAASEPSNQRRRHFQRRIGEPA